MKYLRILIVLFLCNISLYTYALKGEMPIIAYLGVPDWQTSEENFHILKECGFNVSLYPYPNIDLLVKACRYADKYGVKVLGKCPEMISSPHKTASILKKENGFFGYLIQDEPNIHQISERQKEITALRQADDTHVFYINLLPLYENDPEWFNSVAKVKSYPTYLKAASATSCQQISFDYYPITTNGIRKTWYHNLEMVRRESLASKKPFWGFVLSVPHADYPQPTLSSLRLQAYANLAYGAQAIQYFSYHTVKDQTYYFHDAPITHDGKKTKTYTLVQQMNRELKQVAPLFYGAKVTSVKHLGIIPQGTSKLTTMPRNLSSLKVVSSKGAIVSQFTKNKHHYLAIVNKNHWDPMTVLIRAKNSTPRHVTKSLTTEPMKTTYTVAAGDILLFRLQ